MHQKDRNQKKIDCNQIRMILITRMIAVACSMQMSQLLFVSHDLVALVLLILLLCLPLFFQALSGAAPAAPSLAALRTVVAYPCFPRAVLLLPLLLLLLCCRRGGVRPRIQIEIHGSAQAVLLTILKPKLQQRSLCSRCYGRCRSRSDVLFQDSPNQMASQ